MRSRRLRKLALFTLVAVLVAVGADRAVPHFGDNGMNDEEKKKYHDMCQRDRERFITQSRAFRESSSDIENEEKGLFRKKKKRDNLSIIFLYKHYVKRK